MSVLKEVLHDIARLDDPKTAAAFAGLVIALLGGLFAPFGWKVGVTAEALTGLVAAVATVIAYFEKKAQVAAQAKRAQAKSKP